MALIRISRFVQFRTIPTKRGQRLSLTLSQKRYNGFLPSNMRLISSLTYSISLLDKRGINFSI